MNYGVLFTLSLLLGGWAAADSPSPPNRQPRETATNSEQTLSQESVGSLAPALTSRKPLALRGLTLNTNDVPAFAKLEIDLDLDATYDNPFDQADIDVTAVFRGPDGKSVQVPGFFCQDYVWLGTPVGRRLAPSGPPGWKVRFAPPQPGVWFVWVAVHDRSGKVVFKQARFECIDSADRGFVRRSPETPYYLQSDDGAPFFPVGLNLCWDSDGNVDRYPVWFKALGAAGGNYGRLWSVRWNLGLEWLPGKGNGAYQGLGRYAQDNAFKLDWVLEQARAHGIYCMLSLGYHGELMETNGAFAEHCWQENPYNRINGGPCARPADFWTHERARRLYRQRLRYYLARYGWDPHVMSWELWNEVKAPAPWVKEMAGYLKSNDPGRHLVTTTYGDDSVWALAEVDYGQDHVYGPDEARRKTAQSIAGQTVLFTTRHRKPYQIGEFGIDWMTGDNTHDPKGLGTALHDGLWASVMNRGMGTAAIWYWDTYVHPLNLYREYTALKAFLEGTPWNRWAPALAKFGRPVQAVTPATPWRTIEVRPGLGWVRQPAKDIVIRPDGRLGGGGTCSEWIFSNTKPDLAAPLRFRVNYPKAGTLILHVDQVSAGAMLHVAVDGREVWKQALPTGPGLGPWKTAVYREAWKIWQNVYDRDYEVPIPAGEHRVEITNTGQDWVRISSFTFVGARDPRHPPIDQYGLSDGRRALVWLHDQDSNWDNDKAGRAPPVLRDLTTTLRGLRHGPYAVEWWDTRRGLPVTTQTVRSAWGVLPLTPPPFTRDIAARITAIR